jgi:hypothetical protein
MPQLADLATLAIYAGTSVGLWVAVRRAFLPKQQGWLEELSAAVFLVGAALLLLSDPTSRALHSALPAVGLAVVWFPFSRLLASSVVIGVGAHLLLDTPLGETGFDSSPLEARLWLSANCALLLVAGSFLLNRMGPAGKDHERKTARATGLLFALGPFGPLPAIGLLLGGLYLLLRDVFRQPWFLLVMVGLVVLSALPGEAGMVGHLLVIIVLLWIIGRRWAYFSERLVVVFAGTCVWALGSLASGGGLLLWSFWPETSRTASPPAVLLVLVGTSAGLLVATEYLSLQALRALRRRGHSSEVVVHLTATLPLLVLLLLVAVVKLVLSLVEFFGPAVPAVDPLPPDPAFDPPPPDPVFEPVAPEPVALEPAAPDAVFRPTLPESTGAPVAPEAAVPDPPGFIEIAQYERTIADGIPENNYSYDGPRPPGVPEPPGTEMVSGHVRTLPDGIVENNLSYRGPAPESAAVVEQIPVRPSVDPILTEPVAVASPEALAAAAAAGSRSCPCGAGGDQQVRSQAVGGWFCLACGAFEAG